MYIATAPNTLQDKALLHVGTDELKSKVCRSYVCRGVGFHLRLDMMVYALGTMWYLDRPNGLNDSRCNVSQGDVVCMTPPDWSADAFETNAQLGFIHHNIVFSYVLRF